MEYFLRFTDCPEKDLEAGQSFFKNTNQKLKGLCGFRVADTEEEFERIDNKALIEKYQQNFGYSSPVVFFAGKMISRGPVEGDLFTPKYIY